MIETQIVPLDDAQIAVHSRGSGPVCLLVHGFPLNASMWLETLRSDLAYRRLLCAVDLRGHGKSRKQGKKDLAKGVNGRDAKLFNAMHQDVAAAVDWLGKNHKIGPDRIILFGASVGCSVALQYGAVSGNPPAAAVLLLLACSSWLHSSSRWRTSRMKCCWSSSEVADCVTVF